MRWNAKSIVVLILVLIVPYFLTMVGVNAVMNPEEALTRDYSAGKEVIIYILGMVSGWLGGNEVHKNLKE